MKPFQQYAADGWHVVRQAIPKPLVNEVATRFYHDAKTSTEPHLRQSCRVEPNKFDANGFMKAPLLDPHKETNPKLAGFRNAILDLACSAEMLKALTMVTLRPKHVLQQVMLFEQAATAPHQDWVYLDSYPQGCLTAAWIALEDISPKATRFFIVPGSQDFDQDFPHEWIFRSSRYLEAMTEVVQKQYADQIVIPEMFAGDVLFWNSRLIHGSLAGVDPTISRLSLAVHFLPDGFGFGNRETPQQQAHPLPVVTGRPIPYSNFLPVPKAETKPAPEPAKVDTPAKPQPEPRKGNWVSSLLRRVLPSRTG